MRTGKVFIVSGPAGVGKSTTSKKLAQSLKKSAYISGDLISNMPISGYEKPWISIHAKELVWNNIVSLSNNFLRAEYDIVIDWVAFWEDVHTYTALWIEQGVEVRYVILWADEDVHVNRDLQRPDNIQMGERVLILRDEFLASGAPESFFLDNTSIDPEKVIVQVLEESRFLIL